MCLETDECIDHRSCGMLDYQLIHHIHFTSMGKIIGRYPLDSKVNFHPHPEDDRILIADDPINIELANSVREYLMNISLDRKSPILDWKNFFPKNIAVKDMHKYRDILGSHIGKFLQYLDGKIVVYPKL